MTHGDYETRLQKQLKTVGRRLETARANLSTLEAEYEEFEAALRVHERMTGRSRKPKGNGATRKSVLSQQRLIFLILNDAIPGRLSIREICKIAKEQHGRNIPPPSAGSVLSRAKKDGRVVHRDGTWGTSTEDKPALGADTPKAVSSDGQMSAEASPA